MRQQKGYLFHKRQSWFLRHCDDVIQPDGTIERKLVCKKLPVPFGPEYPTKKSVAPFVDEILGPLNAGTTNPVSAMKITDFVEHVYFEHASQRLRASVTYGYRGLWAKHLKGRLGKQVLRDFRTVDGEQLLATIARNNKLSRNSLKHIKSFLSGVFTEAKRLGILDEINPMVGVSIPRVPESEDTHAYTLDEIKRMLACLSEPTATIVLLAALTGLRRGEIRGLRWNDFDGKELSVSRSIWNSVVDDPKTRRSKAPVPVIKELADALELHRARMGKLAVGPIFQNGNGTPIHLDNLAKRVIIPVIERCGVCGKSESDHKPEGHFFKLDTSLAWHGWHAFRRGLATNLHLLHVDDKTIQAILRHSNISLTQNVYIKHVSESGVAAMDVLAAEFRKTTLQRNLHRATPPTPDLLQ
jgi:integrase